MQIRDRAIGPDQPPYVIAEVSCNHAGSEAVAHALIDVAANAGAHAVKFQFYTPEGMVGEERFTLDVTPTDVGVMMNGASTDKVITDGPWAGETMRALYARSQMPWGWGPDLKAHCHREGLAFIASAYDTDGLDWLMAHCVPDALKVASFEATDTPFVELMASKGLPLIVSLGMITRAEIADIDRAAGQTDYVTLHCVSAYPTPAEAANLRNLKLGERVAGWPSCGFSDHTLGHSVACAAVALGACVLEKHIQLSPDLLTADSHFSQTPDQFTEYVLAVTEAWQACQPPVGDVEASSRQFRRAPGGKRGSYGG